MPRYNYQCDDCGFSDLHFHKIEEKIEICPKCSGQHYKKMLNKPLETLKKETFRDEKKGDLTKQYIEANREVLKDMKKENKNVSYKPT